MSVASDRQIRSIENFSTCRDESYPECGAAFRHLPDDQGGPCRDLLSRAAACICRTQALGRAVHREANAEKGDHSREWGAGRLPLQPAPGHAGKVHGGPRRHHRGAEPGQSEQSGDGGPVGLRDHGEGRLGERVGPVQDPSAEPWKKAAGLLRLAQRGVRCVYEPPQRRIPLESQGAAASADRCHQAGPSGRGRAGDGGVRRQEALSQSEGTVPSQGDPTRQGPPGAGGPGVAGQDDCGARGGVRNAPAEAPPASVRPGGHQHDRSRGMAGDRAARRCSTRILSRASSRHPPSHPYRARHLLRIWTE